ncbi:MAG: LysR family transcriptional regulator [Pseudomonadota bacterium]
MLDRSDLALVLAIRDHGRLAAAAEHLGVTPAAVTKRLALIERGLGVRLFARTTRRMSTSDEGELCAAYAARLLEGFDDLEALISANSARVAGRIRLLANAGFGRAHLAPQVSAFQEQYPDIEVELHLSNLLPDLQAEGFDAAVWLWGPATTRWVVARLAPNHRVVVASPAYVARHGMPVQPQDLSGHTCLVMAQRDAFDRMWRLQRLGGRARGKPIDVKIGGALRSNSGDVVGDWALEGRGVALRPLWQVVDHIRAGRLVDMLPGWAQCESDVQWIAPFRANLPHRVVLFKQWLQAAFAKPPWG